MCILCGIPAPDFAIVTRLDGSQAFGSRWEDGADQYRKEETSHADFLLWLAETRELLEMYADHVFQWERPQDVDTLLDIIGRATGKPQIPLPPAQ